MISRRKHSSDDDKPKAVGLFWKQGKSFAADATETIDGISLPFFFNYKSATGSLTNSGG